jgi:hypothetical protein
LIPLLSADPYEEEADHREEQRKEIEQARSGNVRARDESGIQLAPSLDREADREDGETDA